MVARHEGSDAAQRLEPDPVSRRRRPLEAGRLATSDCLAPAGGLAGGLLLASVADGGYLILPRRGLSAGLAASAFVELALRGRVGADGRRLLVTDAAPTGDAVVDPVLELLAARRRAPDVDRCLQELSLDWTILGRAGDLLERRGLVRIERRALHPLLMHRFYSLPPRRPAELRTRLRSIVEGTVSATPRDAALASLAAAAGVLGIRRAGSGDRSRGLSTASRGLDAGQARGVLSVVRPALVAATDMRREAQGACA